jgi:polysaccharide pyruvyl transferase WcaK-like protein
LVRSARSVSVRDRRSFAGYAALSQNVRLEPDAVHAISRSQSFALDKLHGLDLDDYVVVQIRADSIRERGLDYVAGALAELARRYSIAFLAAGTAFGHDNIALYYALSERLKALPGTRPATVLTARDTPSIVGAIARSAAWVGTSLHGRIVATSYDVPRVSLRNEKVANYARSWESLYPADVPIGQVTEAVEFAKAYHRDRVERKREDGLAEKAVEGLLLLNEEMQ